MGDVKENETHRVGATREEATMVRRSRAIAQRTPVCPGCGTASSQRQGSAKELELKG